MGESSTGNSNLEKPNLVAAALHNFTSNFPKYFDQFGFKPLLNKNHFRSCDLSATDHKEPSSSSSSTASLSLEKQMEAWKHNPEWVDHPPIIKVTIPKGSLSYLSLNVDVGLPPDAVYDIVTDPDNKRVFKNIKASVLKNLGNLSDHISFGHYYFVYKYNSLGYIYPQEVVSRKVLVDEGLRQVVEVEQAAIWRFLWWSGTISVHVLVDQNRENHTMKFKQMKSGFMERFEGSWRMEPLFVDEELCHPLKPKSVREYVACSNGRGRIGSRLKLEQLIQPAIVPPPPISWYLRGITTKTTEMLITDLLAEAARIRHASSTTADSEEKSSEAEEGYLCNIKERWALRRKTARHSHRRLSHNSKFS